MGRLTAAVLVLSLATADRAGGQARGDSVVRDSSRGRTNALRVLPVIGSAPETGFVGGATALVVATPTDGDTRPSTNQVYAAYTAKRQFRAFVSTDRWSSGNRWNVAAQAEYLRFPTPFFGVGIDAPESAEEWYLARTAILGATVRRALTSAAYASLGYRLTNTSIRDADSGGVVAGGGIRGARGGVTSLASLGLGFDTRDNIFAPRSGSFMQVTAGYSSSALGADFDFSRYTIDARRYIRIGRGVLAGQAYVEATGGAAPFDQLSLLGSGTTMRGYVRGRYRDRELASVQAEYRMPVAGRFGAAAFGGAGTVASSIGDLASNTILPSYGVGARYLLLPRQGTTVRVDYGLGKGSSGLYIAFNEAF